MLVSFLTLVRLKRGLSSWTLVGQDVTTGPPMYKFMERLLKGDAKAEFTQQANLVGSCTVGNFTTVMATMIVHIFPVLAYQDQKRYIYRYLRKSKTMKVRTFTTKLITFHTFLQIVLDRWSQLYLMTRSKKSSTTQCPNRGGIK